MDKIQVKVLAGPDSPDGMMMFLAKLTQRGHKIKDMDDLTKLYDYCVVGLDAFDDGYEDKIARIAALPHGTIKRFTPITVAIVGASRRFLAQARTHQVGFNYVSASLQYSDYSGQADFVVPYSIIEEDDHLERAWRNLSPENSDSGCLSLEERYLSSCEASMKDYDYLKTMTDNDTAGYVAPQGLRNILIMQGNHESWANFIRLRACSRNTTETQYVALLIWEALLGTPYGKEMFVDIGPDCVTGLCREGKMSCCNSLSHMQLKEPYGSVTFPRNLIKTKWPLLEGRK